MIVRGLGIRFFSFSGHRVAYELVGAGPPLVVPAWWVSHLERDWQDESFRHFWEPLSEGFTLLRYDRLGVGMSDRDVRVDKRTLDDEVEVLEALLDQLGMGRVTLLGGSSGGCAAVAFAARFPDRVEQLLLYGAYAHGPSIAPVEVREAIVNTVRAHWGLGSRLLADVFLGEVGASEQEQFARSQRAATSADTAAALLDLVYRTDVRAESALVRVPTLVAHRRGDRAIPYQLGRELAAAIPGAVLAPLDGSAHFPWAGDAQSVVRVLRATLVTEVASVGAVGKPPPPLLSPREHEVLRLVAKGLSDREIAERLVLSHHTVHRHVANIRHKLACGSRAAAVAEAARAGLL